MKNPTPLQIVLLSSFLVALSVFAGDVFYRLFISSNIDWINAVFTFFTVGIFSFLIFYFFLKQFIYRKIKIIYKSIFDFKVTKADPKTLSVNMSSHIFEEEAKAIEQWAETKKGEIDQLKKMETFRKEFLANVSHELKTPLFNIQGYVETLIDGGLDDPTINVSYLEKASKNISRMNSIINDLENITSLETGQVTLHITTFKITELVKEVYEALSYQAKGKNIALKFKKSCSSGYGVKADKEKIKEVLFNLIGNSIRYGKENGEIQVGCYDMENNLLIEVSDDGIGIAKEHLPHLFERFYRVDRDRSRTSGGTGLGLSIVKHVMEVHNQSVHVRSTVNVGTTFGFTLTKG